VVAKQAQFIRGKIGLSAFGATGPANGGILDSNMAGFRVKTAMRSTASD
jgi:hypothetical protein